MRVLVLAKKFPYPLKDGESIAIDRIAAGFQANDVQADLLAINTLKHYSDTATLDVATTPFSKIDSVTVDTGVKLGPFVKSLLRDTSYNIDRFRSEAFNGLVERTCSQTHYDVVQLEGLPLVHYIDTVRRVCKSKIVLRAHNVEHEIWQRLAVNETSLWKRRLFASFAKRIERVERSVLKRIDGLVTLTQTDADKFKSMDYRGPLHVSPVGMLPSDGDTLFNKPLRLFHIGSMDWMPNVEGLTWFVNDVWLPLRKMHPGLSLHLAGRNFPQALFADNKTVHTYGEVADAQSFMRERDILVVPLFSGSGVRLKILEAMALGKVVISTTKGAEGIPFVPDKHLLIADSAEALIANVERCICENGLVETISRGAKELIRMQYDSRRAGLDLLTFYETL